MPKWVVKYVVVNSIILSVTVKGQTMRTLAFILLIINFTEMDL